jgi:hypothetical protein
VWTQAVLYKAGLGVPSGLLVVQGRAEGCGKIMQAMQRVLRQKGQMFFCERGRQAWHAKWRATGKQVQVCWNSNFGRTYQDAGDTSENHHFRKGPHGAAACQKRW